MTKITESVLPSQVAETTIHTPKDSGWNSMVLEDRLVAQLAVEQAGKGYSFMSVKRVIHTNLDEDGWSHKLEAYVLPVEQKEAA